MSIRFWVAMLALITGLRAATPQVGEMAPAFTLQTIEGKSMTLDALTRDGTVVLVMLRGFPGYQCPLCTRQVREFAGKAQEFAAKGARVVMVYPGPAKDLQMRAKEFLADKAWPGEFVFLVDPDYAFTNAYGLRWEAKNETAYPSTFVIARGGKVTWAKVSKTHGGRSTAAEVLENLR
ncbi:MAG: peroxiredoxin-like family protein [Verrucomicrobiota bacterium]